MKRLFKYIGHFLDSMTLTNKQKAGGIFLFFILIVYLIFQYIKIHDFSHKPVEIYFADRITAAHKQIIDKYNKLNEGKIKVIPIDFPNLDFSTNERKEILARSLRSGGDGIDVIAVDLIWVQRFAKWCEPLSRYFPDESKNRILKSALESCYYDGELVAVPFDLVQGVLYYREDLLKKLANGDKIINKLKNQITWEEFIQLKNQIPSANPYYVIPAAVYEGLVCIYIELLLSLKPDYFEKEGFNFVTPQAEKALQLLVDLMNKYKMVPSEASKFTEIPSYEYYIKNNGLFIRGWQSYDKDFKESPYDSIKEKNLKKAPIPYFVGGRPASVFGGWNLMVPKFSKKKQEAIDFVKFLVSNESQEVMYKESGYYPVVNDFYEKPEYLKKYPEIKEIKSLIATGIHRPSHEEYTRFSKIMSSFIVKAMRNELPVKESLERCSKAIQVDRIMVKDY
ncbi:MAG: extracellular solute-binding protein [Syntrophothermus sp.]